MNAYQMMGGMPAAILPKEWDAIEVRLAALKAELRARFPNQDEDDGAWQRGYEAWQQESVSCLPAGVFLWRDEFERCFKEDFSTKSHSFFDPERSGERELTYAPMDLENEEWEMILKGFLPASPAGAKQPTTAQKPAAEVSQPSAEAAPLRMTANSKASIDAYIDKRARELYAAGEASTMRGIAQFIAAEMESKGYRSERNDYLDWATVVKSIPPGLTGGRGKNGRKPKTN